MACCDYGCRVSPQLQAVESWSYVALVGVRGFLCEGWWQRMEIRWVIKREEDPSNNMLSELAGGGEGGGGM